MNIHVIVFEIFGFKQKYFVYLFVFIRDFLLYILFRCKYLFSFVKDDDDD